MSATKASPGLLVFWPGESPACKAVAMWKWANLIEAGRPTDKPLVWLNFDETAIHVDGSTRRGWKRRPSDESALRFAQRRRHCSLRARRTSLTLMALVSNCADIQSALPQIVLMNEHTLSLAELAKLEESLQGTSVRVWRRKTAWADARCLAAWLTTVRRSLGTLWSAYTWALLWDACPTHLTDRAVAQASRLGFWPCIVPAGMTGTLQPLDTHVFAGFKRKAEMRLETRRLHAGDAGLSMRETIEAWLETAAVSFDRAYPAAFAAVGVTLVQGSLGSRCRAALELDDTWRPPPADLPSLRELHLLAGHPRCLPLGWLFSNLVRSDQRRADTDIEAPIPPASVSSIHNRSARMPRGVLLMRARPPAAATHSADVRPAVLDPETWRRLRPRPLPAARPPRHRPLRPTPPL